MAPDKEVPTDCSGSFVENKQKQNPAVLKKTFFIREISR